jgi:hypothetical protein
MITFFDNEKRFELGLALALADTKPEEPLEPIEIVDMIDWECVTDNDERALYAEIETDSEKVFGETKVHLYKSYSFRDEPKNLPERSNPPEPQSFIEHYNISRTWRDDHAEKLLKRM